MRRWILACVCAWISTAQAADQFTVKPESAILYDKGAEVTYAGKVVLKKGLNELQTNGLKIRPTSAQVTVKVNGNHEIWSSALKFATTSASMRFNTYEEQLEKEIDSLRKEADRWQMTMQLIGYNRYLGSENNSLTTAQLKQQIDFVRVKSVDMWNALNELEDQITARVRMQERSLAIRAREVETVNATVTIFSATGGEETVRFSMYTNQAKWEPIYEIQANPATSGMNLILKANVFQTTGDNWDQVKLTFSTGKPAELFKLPILRTWYVSRGVLYFGRPNDVKLNLPSYQPTVDTMPLSSLASRVYDMRTMVLTLSENEPKPTSAIWRTGIFNNPDQYAMQISNLYDMDGDNIPDYLVEGYGAQVVSRTEYASVSVDAHSEEATTGAEIGYTEIGVASANALKRLQGVTKYAKVSEGKARGRKDNALDVDRDGIPEYDEKGIYTTKAVPNELKVIQEFELSQPLSLLSSNLVTGVQLKSQSIPVTYTYQAFPNNSPAGFLAAELKDWGSYSLMKAPATVFVNGVNSSQTLLNPESESPILKINLGIASDISVSKTLKKEFETKSNSSSAYKELTFEIVIKNNGTQAKTVHVIDFIPHDQERDFFSIAGNFKIFESSGAQQLETGELNWDINLEPGASKRIVLKFQLKRMKSGNFYFY